MTAPTSFGRRFVPRAERRTRKELTAMRKPPKRLFRRPATNEQEHQLVDKAERRRELIRLNEFKIRMIKHEMNQAGDGDDLIVLMLDLNDRLARKIYDMATDATGYSRIGQPVRPQDNLQLIGAPYIPIRENFSPNHRSVFDHCLPSAIRVARLARGGTMAMVIPSDAKLDDVLPIIAVQTEADRKAGTRIPLDLVRGSAGMTREHP